jgi:voltage-gated potassium channel
MALIAGGVGTALYLLTAIAALVLEGQLREVLGRGSMQRRIDQLEEHVIICGYGRLGRVVAEELRRGGAELVVVDADPARESELRAQGLRYLIGSGLADEVLEQAGVRRARAIVVATPSDSDNVFITLSIREKNQRIKIHARGESEAGMRRLRLAGASQVLSAYQSGGMRVAAMILRPSVVDFLDLSLPGRNERVSLEEVAVARGGRLVDRSLEEIERDHPRLRIVALKRSGEAIRIVPDPGDRVEPGDLLVVIGERDALDPLAQAAGRT